MITDMMRELAANPRVIHLVERATATAYKRYRRFVARNDLMQEQWIWLCTNPPRATALLEKSETFLYIRLRTVAERYARKEKATKCGYKPEDEIFYTEDTIIELLPDALDPQASAPQLGPDETPASLSER